MRLALVTVLLGGEPAGAAEPPIRIDDFEDLDLEAAPGLSWVALGDWLVGGTSSGSVAAVQLPPGERSRGALRIEGRLGAPGRGYAGAWTALRGDGTPADLTGYRALRLRLRGTPGRYVVGLRRSDSRSAANFMAPVTVAASWAVVEVPFTDLVASPPKDGAVFSPTSLSWLGITSDRDTPREFTLEIDDVELVPAPPETPPPFALRKTALAEAREIETLSFTTLGSEGAGDGVSPTLPDARELAVAVDPARGLVWFRVGLEREPPGDWLGVNIALDVDGDPANGRAWWGQNKPFHFDRLVTAYLARGSGYWQGVTGVGDAEGTAAGRFDGLTTEARVVVDRKRRALVVGVPRDALGLRPDGKARLIATVGSNFTYNDDLPQAGALDVTIPSVTR
jgi:hypothetical protein